MLNLRSCLALAAIWLVSCSTTEPLGSTGYPAENWTVVNRDTGEPIPDAWISIRYFRTYPGLGDSQTVCIRAESFKADGNSHFKLPPEIRDTVMSKTAAKLGYTMPIGRINDPTKREVYLVPFTGTQDEVFYNALRESQPSQCHSDDDKVRELPKRKYFFGASGETGRPWQRRSNVQSQPVQERHQGI